MQKAIIYTRVSTNKQGGTGLGLQAQLDIAMAYCQQNQLEVIEHFSEVQSGGKNDRDMMKKALRRCELTGAKLVVAKLDRISRDIGFIDALQKSKVAFVCADMPEANDSMVAFMAVFAEYERKMASERTKAALQAKKEAGVKLGKPENFTKEHRQANVKKATESLMSSANDRAKLVAPDIQEAIQSGCKTLKAIAEYLNDRYITTPRGCNWTPVAVSRTIKRMEITL